AAQLARAQAARQMQAQALAAAYAAQQAAAQQAAQAQQLAAQQAAQAQQQAAQAQQAAPAQQAAQPLPQQAAPPAGVGGYANPLRAISNLSPERIDQGVDYAGFGPIYAIGNGVVLSTVNSGWPGGTFIAYRLTSGPAAGLVAYAAEDIYPQVQVGQTVTSSTALGTMYGGPDGIETGWATSSGSGQAMASSYGQFSGSNTTAFGYNFSMLLQALGAPGGVVQNSPPTGSLPGGWPTW
ncbi:MAG: hypothetical protein ACYDH5_18570, partial [Acidimicrobiales bacterium]